MVARILVTGGAGFIGSALCRHLIAETKSAVINLDKLTYAANPESLAPIAGNPRYAFEQADICAAFIETNVVGTCILLEAARDYWRALDGAARADFRFIHISTDEVYGSLGQNGLFREDTPYAPNSPYSASKAGADHLARAWYHTYGLPVIITNCSNNYGPCQFPEKLIPLMIINAVAGRELPVYGRGENRRDWLHVEDHVRGLCLALTAGKPGGKYNFGGGAERSNLEVVRTICAILDRSMPDSAGSRERLIRYVTDRPGHDLRYAVDAAHAQRELGWAPRSTFESGLEATVNWYLENTHWWQGAMQGRYDGGRLGLAG